jgi:hypothetical protein
MSRAPIFALLACACWGGGSSESREVADLQRALQTCMTSQTDAAGPDLETIAGWMTAAGDPPERLGDVLRVVADADGHRYGITVQLDAERHLVYLATTGLMTLQDTSGDAGVVSLLTNLATLNYETMQGKLQLNPATGEVVLSIELETDDGLGQRTFGAALKSLNESATSLRPKLVRAATSAEL